MTPEPPFAVAPRGRLALLGSRGIPASYGGYETLMEELAPRLVERGWEVTVYCRSHHTPPQLDRHRGVRLVVLPTLRTRHLDTPVHTLLSALHALVVEAAAGRPYDAALVVNGANALFVPLLRLAGSATALHVDGIERQRSKWGRVGRAVYALSERLACMVADRVVSDAEVIRRYYREHYGCDSVPITYGVDVTDDTDEAGRGKDVLRELGLEPRRYFLYVSRFEPENNPHRVVEAYRSVGGELPLVMVGDAPYAREFIDSFRRAADPRVLFPGAVYGRGYRQLQSHALAYVQATEVGGTHPALVEAMGHGNCVVVNDTPENREVAGDVGLYFRAAEPATLAARLEGLRRDPERAHRHGAAAAERARSRYSWEAVTDRYEELFQALLGVGPEPGDDPVD